MALTKVSGNEIDNTSTLSTQSISVSGVSTVGSLSIGATSVISSARQLQNIASLDATTTATIESAITNAPNTFTDLKITGISTLGVTSATNFIAQSLSVSGISTLGVTSVTNLTAQQLNISGIVTATTFVGALTGTATSTTNIPNLTGAITSVNTTTSLGSFTSAQLATALTDETGSGVAVFATSPTLSTVTVSSGGINVTGVSTFSGGIQGNVTGNVNSSGVSTFSSVNVTGNVSIGGTLTYDDVTNVDSIGLVTARSGVRIDAGGLVVTAGVSTFTTGPVIIGAATSTGTASQRLQVTGGAYVSGNIGIGTNKPTAKLQVVGSTDLNKLNLSGISSSISSTAVDVFVYDTRKDSDGGAWRKRTQSTSWYNETLNTATRGARKEFPAVAVIIATTNTITIYDGDDPDMPMWMVFTDGYATYLGMGVGGITAVTMFNGIMSHCGTYDLHVTNFISDKTNRYGDSGSGITVNHKLPISGRNDSTDGNYNGPTTPSIANRTGNDVAMTVLPNAPIDAATGLPVPTIAVATVAGVSIIKDDGTVESTDNANIIRLGFIKGDRLAYGHRAGYTYAGVALNVAPFRNSITYGWYVNSTVPSFGGSDTSQSPGVVQGVGDGDVYAWSGATGGIRRINENITSSANGMVAYATTSYNTGWMHGDIKGAWLSDTSTASVTGTALLTGQASTYNVDTSNGGWTSQPSATNAYNAANGVGSTGCIRLTSTGGSNVWNSLSLGTVISGAKYSITFSAKIASSVATSFTVSQSQFNGTSYLDTIMPTVTTSHVTYSFIFTASSTTAWFNVFAGNGTGSALDVDNIDVRLLAEPDRSVNSNGLAVYGTLTKTAVATGSNLVGYSGFGASNYLYQPYNSTLAVGTGDICFMGWAKTTVSGNYELLFDYGLNLSNEFRVYFISDGTGILLQATANSFSSYDSVTTTIGGITSWKHLTIIRRNLNNYQVYVNGVLVQNSTLSYFTTFSNSGNNSPLYFGNVSGGNPSNASMALWRVSASVPSPTQIAKIYNDEKMLFQENSQCTLYGSSDAVTALAYDDSNSLLSVGTSSGRSDFRGLERINNTTTAVTTAISASNGLIAEQ